MKKVVLTLGVALLSILLLMLCACGDAAQKTLIYGGTDLTEYVKLGDYKGLTVDTSSENYEASYKAVIEKDISDNGIVGADGRYGKHRL